LAEAMGNLPTVLCACPGTGAGPAKLGLDPGEAAGSEATEQEPAVMVTVPVASMKVLPESLSGSYLHPSEIGRLVGDDVCAICLEPLRLRAQTIALCGHVFHRCCLNRCGDLLCPQCRQPIDELTGTRWGLFSVGTSVTICGLQNHVELNGTRCRVVEIHEASHRLEVRTAEGGRLYRVRPENLVVGEGPTQASDQPIDAYGTVPAAEGGNQVVNWEALLPGASVKLTGLHMAHYNGRTAVVLWADRATGRCEIQLGDGSVKTIRAENLRVAAPDNAVSGEPPPAGQQDEPDQGRITL